MTSRDFCYWLQGLFELSGAKSLDEEQTATIRAHLAMVFAHEIDPSQGTPEHREELQRLHDRKEPCGESLDLQGSRKCTRPKGHDGPHAFDAAQAMRDEQAHKKIEELKAMLEEHRKHPPMRGDLKLMC
jgi:hypothetical protein